MPRRFIITLAALVLALTLAMPAFADGVSGIIGKAANESATSAPAAVPTVKSTSAPTVKPASTAKATSKPAQKPTQVPTVKPTSAPTAEPTEEPTVAPTPEPTPTPLPLPVKQDDQGDIVKLIQQRLRTLGFLDDSADGYFGPRTRKGVIAFQEFVAEHIGTQLHYVDPNATPEPTAEPTAAPEPTEQPTAEATPIVTALHYYGSSLPTAEVKATAVPTLAPTAVPTPEPTPEPTPYVADGIVDGQGYELLAGDDFQVYYEDLTNGSEGSDVKRLQTRLTTLYYLGDGVDGMFGSNTEYAVKYFQKHNDLDETGVADEATQQKLYSEDAVPTAKPTLEPASKKSKGNGKNYSKYELVVDISDQRVYVYGYTNGAYGPLSRVFVCSTGTKSHPTPLGTFKGSGPTNRWHYFVKFDCYAQYSWRIDGDILFHSVLYNEIDGKPTSSSVNNLGSRASHGCIRLSVENAKWIYNNCKRGTTVIVRE